MTTLTELRKGITFNGEVMKEIKGMIKSLKKNNIMPILENAYFQFKDDKLTVTVCTSDLIIENEFDIIGEGSDSFLLPFDTIKKVTGIKKDNQYKITLIDENTLAFNKNNAIQQVKVDVAENYPKLPVIHFETLDSVSYDEILNLNKALTSIFKSETRPVLQSVLVRNGYITSTDSHRLFKTNSQLQHDTDIILRELGVKKLKDVFNKNDLIHVSVSDNNDYTMYSNGRKRIVIRFVEGRYPEINRLIPDHFTTEFTVYNVKEFLQTVDDARKCTINEKNNVIKFDIQGVKLTITAGIDELGKYENTLEINNFVGEDLTISMSGTYLYEGLKQIDADSVQFKLIGAMRPFIITPVDNENDTMSLILPVRTTY